MAGEDIKLANALAARLERLSADSYWAHQASGVRGSLLRCLSDFETNQNPSKQEQEHLEGLIERGFYLLVQAAREY